jgi:tRNA/rRNA methyltransferase
VADCHHVIATSARERLMNKPICDAREWAAKPLAGKTAILFGRERTGLDNEEVALAHSLLTIPVNPDYASLNLAQSVGIICYEWFQQQGEHPARPNRARLATQAEVSDFLNQLENALDEVNFWRVAHKKPRMWRNLRSVFLRNELKSNEVLTLRGVVKSLRRK